MTVSLDYSVKSAYRQFLNSEAGMNAYNKFKQILYGPNDSLVEVVNETLDLFMEDRHAAVSDVCDIGGGDGIRTRNILRHLSDRGHLSNCHLDFIEQSGCMIGAFDDLDISAFVKARKYNMLFEHWAADGRYDLLFLIHSIFAFENASTVKKVLSMARPGGAIVVATNAADSFLAGLKRIVDSEYADSRFEVDQLRDVLTDNGFVYEEYPFTTKWSVPLRDMESTRQVILDWLSLGAFSHTGREQSSMVEAYFEDNSTEAYGARHFEEKEVLLFIGPPAGA